MDDMDENNGRTAIDDMDENNGRMAIDDMDNCKSLSKSKTQISIYRLFFLFLLLVKWDGYAFCLDSKTFNNPVLCLLDENHNNFTRHTYFFRGKLPQCEGEFCYDDLKNQILAYLSRFDRPISPDFKLICISLLNNFADRKECQVESKWFSCHQNKGYIWRYPLFGYFCSPVYVPAPLRKAFYYTDIDGLCRFIGHLKHLMECEYEEDVVIYMHCRAGKDRTGEASACYLMQYKDYSYPEAITLNQQIAGRKLRTMSINAILWYAYYLRDIK